LTLFAFTLGAQRRSAHPTAIDAGVIAGHDNATICALFLYAHYAVLDVAFGDALVTFR
jgi:hypothetical protein